MTRLSIGVIGCGQWGSNHIRTFNSFHDCTVRRASDLSATTLKIVRERYEQIITSTDPLSVIESDDIQAVIIATPTRTHHALAKAALLAGKHVLCEKPLTLRSEESKELVAISDRKGLVLMVGHVFMYNPGILYLKEQILAGSLGSIQYMDAVRTNFGPVRTDVGAMYDLASHDISIFNFLLASRPIEISAQGACYLQDDHEDVAFIVAEYPNNVLCHVHVSWLSPRKVRQLTLVGDQRMAVWDDMSPTEPVRIYDRGLQDKPYYDSFGQFQMILRDADITIPRVAMFEPLAKQARAFIDCVQHGNPTSSNAHSGEAVVVALEAAMQSMRNQGRRVVVGG